MKTKTKTITRKKRTTKEKKTMVTATETGTLKLIDKCPRSPLGEGRSYGIGFAMAKREGDSIVLVGPISPCREYLNDQLYSEIHGKPCGAYGYSAKKEGLLDADKIYIVFAILPQKYGGSYSAMERDTKHAAAHYQDLNILLAQLCALMGKEACDVLKLEDNRYLIIADKWWGTRTYLTSLLTLVVRVAVEGEYIASKYEGQPFEKVFSDLGNKSHEDGSIVKNVIPKLEPLSKGVLPAQEGQHGAGIYNQKF